MRHWDELTKKQKKHIRDMAGVAYEREMAAALEKLHASFQEWGQGKITPFALDDKVHQYHNGAARDLYKQYATGNPDMAVTIVRGGVEPWERV